MVNVPPSGWNSDCIGHQVEAIAVAEPNVSQLAEVPGDLVIARNGRYIGGDRWTIIRGVPAARDGDRATTGSGGSTPAQGARPGRRTITS